MRLQVLKRTSVSPLAVEIETRAAALAAFLRASLSISTGRPRERSERAFHVVRCADKGARRGLTDVRQNGESRTRPQTAYEGAPRDAPSLAGV